MDRLPPKWPTITVSQNWPHSSAPFQMMPPPRLSTTATWVDDFLDFAATRRSHHRRTVSDPIAFMETPTLIHNNHSFEKLDDEQLTNMFSNDLGRVGPPSGSDPSSVNPSTPSPDHNGSVNMSTDEKINLMSQPNVKDEPGEEEDDDEGENGNLLRNKASTMDCNASSEAIVDPKRIKRILANRQSAQRSRVRKLHYISELERSVTTLQTEVSALSPRVAFLDHQRLLLNVDNSALKQRIAALAQDKIFKDAHQEALRKEIERLRRVYHEQTMKKMNSDEEPSFAATTTAGNERVSSDEE